MKSKHTVWYSLIIGGFLLSLVFPTAAIFGFSLSVFFIALSKDFLGYRGLLVYYPLYCLKHIWDLLYFYPSLGSKVLQPVTLTTSVETIKAISSTGYWHHTLKHVIAIDRIITLNFSIQSQAFQVLLTGMLISMFLSAPLIWYFICRRVIRRHKLVERLGLRTLPIARV